jgi:L-fuconate dehydratase
VPLAPGYSIEMLPDSLDEYEFPTGPAWASAGSRKAGR